MVHSVPDSDGTVSVAESMERHLTLLTRPPLLARSDARPPERARSKMVEDPGSR
jgi:hypothetical protein